MTWTERQHPEGRRLCCSVALSPEPKTYMAHVCLIKNGVNDWLDPTFVFKKKTQSDMYPEDDGNQDGEGTQN